MNVGKVTYRTTQQRGQMKSILDPSFRYTSSVETDLRKTFAKVRRALRKQVHVCGAVNGEVMGNVLPLRTKNVAQGR